MNKLTRRTFITAGLAACAAEAVRRERHRPEPLGEAAVERLVLTVAPALQRAAIESIVDPVSALVARRQLPPSTEIALVAMRTDTGDVVAYVPRRDLSNGFDIARRGRRDVGSLAKLFCYASAFTQGALHEDDLLDDLPRVFPCQEAPGGRLHVTNSHGAYTMRKITSGEAIARSSNVCATEVNLRQDRAGYAALLARLGFLPPKTPAMLALAGISLEATLLELAGALSAFARGGAAIRPRFIEQAAAPAATAVFTESAVRAVVNGMRDCLVYGTGTSARRHVAAGYVGKTGTSFDALATLVGPRLLVVARLCDGARYRDIKIAGAAVMRLLADFLDQVAVERPDLYR